MRVRIKEPPSIERLLSAFTYEPETGLFRYSARACGRAKEGRVAGAIKENHGNRYIQLEVDRKHFPAHRMAWLYVYGEWPQGMLDHINGDGSDNRITNLRLATNSLNMANRRRNKNSTSPYKGVRYVKKWKCWVARIQKDKKRIEFGGYRTPEEAHAAYVDAAQRAFGDFARFS